MSKNTLTFDEKANGWTSFYSYNPELMTNLHNDFYSFKGGQLYIHNVDSDVRNTFYGESFNTEIEPIINDAPSDVKMFKTVEIEGDSKEWDVEIYTDLESGHVNKEDFENKEGFKYSYIRRNAIDEVKTELLSVQGVGVLRSISGTTTAAPTTTTTTAAPTTTTTTAATTTTTTAATTTTTTTTAAPTTTTTTAAPTTTTTTTAAPTTTTTTTAAPTTTTTTAAPTTTTTTAAPTTTTTTTAAPTLFTGGTFDGVEYNLVTSPATGRTWLDRNLGANRVATSATDTQSYGWYFQWGRKADGHQLTTSTSTFGTTTRAADPEITTDQIYWVVSAPYDWDATQNTTRWQVGGINNPCPPGFRLPTIQELLAESAVWSSYNDAFNGFLKLPTAGSRTSNGNFAFQDGSRGYIASATEWQLGSSNQLFWSAAYGIMSSGNTHTSLFPVRPIKDE
jgi:hypothetical protein